MCGIAGRILKDPGPIGRDLVELMDAQVHRGADSTGFALYGQPLESGYIVRAVGFERSRLDSDLEDFKSIINDQGCEFAEDPVADEAESRHVSVRMVVSEIPNLPRWTKAVDEISSRFEVQSVGKSLEIIKDIGTAADVADKHGVREYGGTHGLGHARLATESSVIPTASHPFWARPFPDVAIVHNGQITNYYLLRDKLERQGYRFMTANDSELIAVWISDRMRQGMEKPEALRDSIKEIDGVFTYLIADRNSIGFAKDKWAIKPLVVMGEEQEIAVATEEQAVRRIYLEEGDVENFDGPAMTHTWPVMMEAA
ncbi:MAG: glutamine amidotransferase [Albidovulum sp.]|nr:glutamine amidotransferase [Albidovulum sp.]MDE0530076.1 glutamine amidotransferase [Albidovulum sp.]